MHIMKMDSKEISKEHLTREVAGLASVSSPFLIFLSSLTSPQRRAGACFQCLHIQ